MSKQQKRIFWPSLAMMGLALTTIVFVSARARIVASTKANAEGTATEQRVAPEFKQRISIWVHRDDVRPKVIHAWPGKAQINVENQTQSDVSLQVERVLPNRTQTIGAVNLSARLKRLRQEVTLVPGDYIFYEASRSDIRGRIVVKPRK